jgi:hypothetical protein
MMSGSGEECGSHAGDAANDCHHSDCRTSPRGWGSNQVAPGPTFFHQWYHLLPGPGSYQVCMEADDADGERCTACQLVTVYM